MSPIEALAQIQADLLRTRTSDAFRVRVREVLAKVETEPVANDPVLPQGWRWCPSCGSGIPGATS